MAVNIGEPKFKVGDLVELAADDVPEFMGRVTGVETCYKGVETCYTVEDIRAIERRAAAAEEADNADEADDASTTRSKPRWPERIRSLLRKTFGDDAERALELSTGPEVRTISESQLKLRAKFIPQLFKVGDEVQHEHNRHVGLVEEVFAEYGEPYYIVRDKNDKTKSPLVVLIPQNNLRKHMSGGGYKKRSKSSKSKTKKRRRKGRKTRRHRRKHKQKNA